MHLPTLSAILDSLGGWLAMAGLGTYHGLNPGMGWLFALALGLQQQNDRAVLIALLPIALGHAVSLVLVAVALAGLGAFLPPEALHLLTVAGLLAFGAYKLVNYYRHPRWVGMRVSLRELFGWSFLMSTAHGAGLMIAPVLLGISAAACASAQHAHHCMPTPVLAGSGLPGAWGLAIGVHTLAMLLTMAVVAWVVYRKLGLAVLRRGWINFDLIWSVALLAAGGITLIIM